MNRFIIFLTIFVTHQAACQDILIYHGTKGTSTIVEDYHPVSTSIKRRTKVGEEILIKIINAHPALYNYQFSSKQVEIDDPEFPDFSSLLASLTGELGLETREAVSGRVAISPGTTWPDEYKKKVDEFEKWIKEAEQIIKTSDFPEPIHEAIDGNSNGGFLYAKKELLNNGLFSLGKIDDYISNWQKEIKGDGNSQAPYYYDKSDDHEKTLMELYDNYFKTLSLRAKEILSSYKSSVSSTVSYRYTVTEKKNIVTLKITAKNSKLQNREVGDSVITITTIPDFERPILELVPVALVSQSSKGKSFGISDGVITESTNDEFQFGTGASLNLNFANWGQRNEISAGLGLGFALVDQDLNNFFVNTTLSYGKWARVGLGYGWLKTATSLKNGLKSGSDANNIENIEELISYSREPAFFLTFVIPGLNLPLTK